MDTKITKKDLASVNITAKDLVYKKGKYKSTPVLTDSDGKKLKAGTDYTLKYANNKKVTDEFVSKWPTVTITFKGNFKGTEKTS